MDINLEAVSALNLDKCLVDNFINDGASDDRAYKCSVRNHYYFNGRRRFIVSQAATTTDRPCKYIAI